jgi:Leucine-rich repeat (LRR) protein/serine/threonine protein phosphatase PrpC
MGQEGSTAKNHEGGDEDAVVITNKPRLPTTADLERAKTNKRLILSCRNLKTLPTIISQLEDLTLLDVASNNFKAVPSIIADLDTLTHLDLSCNMLNTIPKVLGKLEKLDTLILSHNNITIFPGSLLGSKLRVLEMEYNSLKVLPSLETLEELHTLKISQNQVTSIEKLSPKLQYLEASNNKLSEFPPTTSSILELTLNGNEITEIPTRILSLELLHTLNLDRNQVTNIPPELCQLTRLRALHLRGNNITSLPNELTKLGNLRTLDVSCNQIEALSPDFAKLSGIATLNISSNRISEIPDSIISCLTSLSDFYAADNRITELPRSLYTLTTLRSLVLSYNKISEPISVGRFLKNISRLRMLALSGNAIPLLEEDDEEPTSPQLPIVTSAEAVTSPPESASTCTEKRPESTPPLILTSEKLVNSSSSASASPSSSASSSSSSPPSPSSSSEASPTTTPPSCDTNSTPTTEPTETSLPDSISIISSAPTSTSNATSSSTSSTSTSTPSLSLPDSSRKLSLPPVGTTSTSQASPRDGSKSTLRELYLAGNRLKTFPEQLAPMLRQLRTLDLGFNEIETLNPQLLGKCTRKEWRVDITYNHLTETSELEETDTFLFNPQRTKQTLNRRFSMRSARLSQNAGTPLVHPESLDSPVPPAPSTPSSSSRVKLLSLDTQVGSSGMSGKREGNEDVIAIGDPFLAGRAEKDTFYAAVFDGHGGRGCANLLQEHLHKFLSSSIPSNFRPSKVLSAIKRSFHKMAKLINKNEGIKKEGSGATAVVSLFLGGTLYVANVGDARCVLCTEGKGQRLSVDHTPKVAEEQQRVREAGGFVTSDGRVNGRLAVSRAFGDISFIPLVSSDPFINKRIVTPQVRSRSSGHFSLLLWFHFSTDFSLSLPSLNTGSILDFSL